MSDAFHRAHEEALRDALLERSLARDQPESQGVCSGKSRIWLLCVQPSMGTRRKVGRQNVFHLLLVLQNYKLSHYEALQEDTIYHHLFPLK